MLDYAGYKKIVNESLMEYLPKMEDESKTLKESMIYSLTAGGKRLRPVLILASCDFAMGYFDSAIPYAVSLEYIHTYSLIHDDLPAMDDDNLRRGIPTNHVKFGEGMAILAGDGLLNSAYEIISGDIMKEIDPNKLLNKIKAFNTIAHASGICGMVSGQSVDLESEGKMIDSDLLNYIHKNKTGALIKAAILAGLYLGGADEDTIEIMKGYGENLGLAFQISDDILDVKGSSKELGKSAGKDEENGKATFVSIYGLAEAEKKLEETIKRAIDDLSKLDNTEFFREFTLAMSKRTY